MITSSFLVNVIGWIGAVLVLIAYGLLSIKWLAGTSFSYQALNVTGAILLVINSYYLGAYPSVGVNAAWVGIAALTLFLEWWKGPADAYKKVANQFSKRVHLRKISLQRVKLPLIKQLNHKNKKDTGALNRLGQPQPKY